MAATVDDDDKPLAVGTLVYAFPKYGNSAYTFYRVKEHRTARVIILEELAAQRDTGWSDGYGSSFKYWLVHPVCVVVPNVRATLSKEYGWSVKGAAADGSSRKILSDTAMENENEIFEQNSYY